MREKEGIKEGKRGRARLHARAHKPESYLLVGRASRSASDLFCAAEQCPETIQIVDKQRNKNQIKLSFNILILARTKTEDKFATLELKNFAKVKHMKIY